MNYLNGIYDVLSFLDVILAIVVLWRLLANKVYYKWDIYIRMILCANNIVESIIGNLLNKNTFFDLLLAVLWLFSAYLTYIKMQQNEKNMCEDRKDEQ